MYDNLKYEKANLPVPKRVKELYPDVNWKEVNFQTKDLENFLGCYVIDKRGQLKYQQYDEAGIVKGFVKDTRTAYVNFYHFLTTTDIEGFDIWIEFRAHLKLGVVQSIEVATCEETPARERIEQRNKWEAKYKKEEEFSKTLYGKCYKFVAKYFNKSVWGIINALNKLTSYLYRVRM